MPSMKNQSSKKRPGKNQQSVAVIGAGVVGLCTAIELQRAGYKVTLFDKADPAKEASFGNACWIADDYFEPLATAKNINEALVQWLTYKQAFAVMPEHILAFIPWAKRFLLAARRQNVDRISLAKNRINIHALDAWKDILGHAKASGLLVNSGCLKVWENKRDIAKTEKYQAWMEQWGYSSQMLQGETLFEQEPVLSREISHALYFPAACQLADTYEVCLHLFDFFQQTGGTFKRSEVHQVQAQNNGVIILTGSAKSEFDKAVIASGAWSKQLTKMLGLEIPLAAERGYHLTLPDAAKKPVHIIESKDRHVVLISVSSGFRITGFAEYANLSSNPVEKRYHRLRKHLQALTEGVDINNQPVSTWVGIRPTLPDSLPVIDLHPEHPQIGMVFGHNHLGVTQAAISAKIISKLLTGGQHSEILKPFTDVLDDYSATRF